MTGRYQSTLLTLALWLTIVSLPSALFGQTTTASIAGEVRDQTGAVIPEVTLTITNVETGITRTTSSDATGRYRAQNLPVGSYQVDASHTGFKAVTRRGITLTVGQAAEVDITLEVGAVTEMVEVTGEAPLVDTNTAVLGGLVEQRAIQDLPLNGRSFLELATLQAGTVHSRTGGQSESQGYGQKISISGGRFTSNLFLIDGTVMNDSFNSAGGSADGVAAGVETVREFKVITNSYSAEYGQHTGGVINAVTRGGTNEFHGSVYEFLRNDNLDAFRWEDKARTAGAEPVKPEFRRNQFGASIGGPVIRDKTFFFGNYEGLRESLGDSQLISIPDENARLGRLPNLSTADPNDFVDYSGTPGFAKVRPFFDKLWPIPADTTLERRGDGTMDYTRALNEPTKLNFVTARVDHKLSDNGSLFGRYTIDHADREPVDSINVFSNQRTRNQFVTFQYDRILSPTVLNSFNLGFTRSFTGVRGSSLPGYERVTFSDSEFGHGVVNIDGVESTGSGNLDPRIFILNNYQAKNDLTWNRGSHTFKIGGNFSRLQHNDTSPRQPAGQFDFASLEDFLQADVEEALISLAENYVRHTRQSIFGLYFQDDYRIMPNLMLNLGVRWEMTTAPTFAADLAGMMPIALEERFFDPTVKPSDIQLADALFLENPSKNNFAPRIGFAWDPFNDGKTSIRGGAGIFHEALVYWTYRLAILHTAPLFNEGRLTNATPGGVDFPNAYFTQRALFTGAPRYESFQKTPNQPYIGKFSLEIQRQFTPSALFRIGYSGTRGVHLPNRQEQNGRIAQVRSDGRLFIPGASTPVYNPNFGRTRHRRTNGTMDYHSMRLEVEKRLSGGLLLNGNYTFAKNIDDGTSVTGGTDFSNDAVPRHWSVKDPGLSAVDVRHTFTVNSVYSLPGQNMTGWLGPALGGWQLSGLLRVSSGLPFSAQTGFDWARQTEGGRYPDLKSGQNNNPTSGTSIGCVIAAGSIGGGTAVGTPDLYFDPCVYELPLPRGLLGNVGRNTMIGPGVANIDLKLGKTFNLSMVNEDTKLEFRGELFNAFNHPNFSQPGQGVFDSTTLLPSRDVGRIDSTSGNPRKIQFGLKLIF